MGTVGDSRAASGGVTAWALPLVMACVGLGVLWVAPTVAYRCQAGEAGARCEITWRYAGLFALQRSGVSAIQRAAGSTSVITGMQRNGQNATGSESVSSVKLYGDQDRQLFSDIQSGVIGNSAEEIADEIGALAARERNAPLLRWQTSWLPLLFASLMLLLSVPSLAEALRVRIMRTPASAAIGRAEWALIVLPLVLGWTLAFAGAFPDYLATLLGLPGR